MQNSSLESESEKVFSIYRTDQETIVLDWNQTCNNLLDENYRKTMQEINRRLSELKPEKLLVDLSQCMYVVSSGTNWYDHTLSGIFGKSNPEYLAFVVPSNLFNHIMFEATQAAEKMKNTDIQYFRSREKAANWLSSF
ncbi:MAG: hypothetical protein KDC05_14755 [Bacteroidales bacterium]|nr:hypothetical protein [Bacteroidales bacterium]